MLRAGVLQSEFGVKAFILVCLRETDGVPDEGYRTPKIPGKEGEKTLKKTRNSSQAEPLKSLEKKGKRSTKKKQGILRKKGKKTRNSKKKQGKEGQGGCRSTSGSQGRVLWMGFPTKATEPLKSLEKKGKKRSKKKQGIPRGKNKEFPKKNKERKDREEVPFSGRPLRGFQRSGSYPRATDNSVESLGNPIQRTLPCDPEVLLHPPCPSFPCFFGIPCFFPLRGIPCFFERFPLLFQGF